MLRVQESGNVGLPRLEASAGRRISDVRVEVVLIPKVREVVPEFMDEDANGGRKINADRGVEPKIASVPILLGVHHNPHHVIGGKRCHAANGTIIERQGVTLGAENIKLRTEKRVAVDARRRMRHTRVRRRRADRPDVEILAALLEGRIGENTIGETAHIILAFIQSATV